MPFQNMKRLLYLLAALPWMGCDKDTDPPVTPVLPALSVQAVWPVSLSWAWASAGSSNQSNDAASRETEGMAGWRTTFFIAENP